MGDVLDGLLVFVEHLAAFSDGLFLRGRTTGLIESGTFKIRILWIVPFVSDEMHRNERISTRVYGLDLSVQDVGWRRGITSHP